MSNIGEITRTLLRVVAGFVFMLHGGQKLLGWFGGMGDGSPLPPLMMAAGIIELVGGALIMLGLFTRPAAFISSGEMAVAYFMAHQPRGPLPITNNGEVPVLLCFIFLFFAAVGAGAYSVDAAMSRARLHEPIRGRVPAP
jgi:putative oxidoreductase